MTTRPKVLVTGATGFLGARVVKRLIEEGYPVRALARARSKLRDLQSAGAEIAFGDLRDESSIAAAVRGQDVVVHAAAGTRGSATESDSATIQGTHNVLQACQASGIKKLIYISSCSVYGVAGYTENQMVTEDAQLEGFPERRGRYSAAKLQAEALVTEAMDHGRCRAVVLRLGTLFGPGADVYSKMMGIDIGRFIFVVFGNGHTELPLLYVDNAVDAIVQCIRQDAACNYVFNVIDHDRVTKRMYIERVVRPLYPNSLFIYCPMSLLLTMTWLQEKVLTVLGKKPLLTVYRLLSSQKRIAYSTSKIEKVLGWCSNITFEQSVEQVLNAHRERLRESRNP